jgi:hypothetical protein
MHGQRRAHASDFVIFQRALRLSASQAQLIKLRDEILGVDPQLLSK